MKYLPLVLFGFITLTYIEAQDNTSSSKISDCDWLVNGNHINYSCGKVGIGVCNPRTIFHIVDTNSQLYFGYQTAYNGPYINLIGEVAGTTPMLGMGLAQQDYVYNSSVVARSGWGYVYGNDLNEGIAILPRMAYAPAGLYVKRDGLVGIGTDEPIETLDINGGLKIGDTYHENEGTIRWTGNDFEGFDGTNWLSFTQGTSGSYPWQLSGNNLYYNSGKVGIGVSNPRTIFHIVDINSQFYFGYQEAYNGPYINLIGETAGQTPMIAIGLAQNDYEYHNNVVAKASWGYIYGNDLNEGIAILPRMAYAPEGLYVEKDGKVGIGTDSPEARLHVANGDIYISDINRGIIMKSPDGNCWRGTLDNNGSLNFVQINCEELALSAEPSISNTSEEKIDIFPNPSQSIVSIDCKTFDQPLWLSIYDVDGGLIDRTNIYGVYHKNISGYSSGIYLFRIEDINGNIMAIKKVVKY